MIYDVAIIGGGPGGYVAAIKAAQNGLNVILFEKEHLGGVCLNKGCIPTKALLKSAAVFETIKHSDSFGITSHSPVVNWADVMKRKEAVVNQLVSGVESLMKANKITVVEKMADIKDHKTITADGMEYEVKNIIIATGSAPVLPPIEGIDKDIVMTSDEMLKLKALPKKLVIIGGGVIGLEFAFLMNRMGVSVTVIEMLDSIIAMADADIIKAVEKDLNTAGIQFITRAKVSRVDTDAVAFIKDDTEVRIDADAVLIATGRKPLSDKAQLDQLGIPHDGGMILTDNNMRTNVAHIYAIGDVNGKLMLAHTASEEGIVAVENILGKSLAMEYNTIPQCIYLEPEVAWVGMTEKQASDAGHKVKTGIFPILANGKSLIEGEPNGFIKFVIDERFGEILGAHLYCLHATDMIAEVTLAMKTECCIEDIASCIHSHPTTSEALMEAANAAVGRAIHSL